MMMSRNVWCGVALCALVAVGCDDDSDDNGAGGAGGAVGGAGGAVGGAGGAVGGAGGEVGGAGGEVGGAGGEVGGAGGEIGGAGGEIGGAGGMMAAEPAIFGDYIDNFGGGHWIGEGLWIQTYNPSVSAFNVTEIDAEGQFLIAENDADNEYNPGLWSRFDWVIADGALYYCQTAFDAATAEDAAAVARADDADPANGGCGVSAWSALAEGALPFAGEFSDEYGTDHLISSAYWRQTGEGFLSELFVVEIDAEAQHLIGQNGPDNGFNPELWSRVDWTYVGEDLYYCQSAFDAETAEAAAATPRADDSDPTVGGCGGAFPWSMLTAAE